MLFWPQREPRRSLSADPAAGGVTMMRPLCGLLSVLTIAVIGVQASGPLDPPHPDLSGTYTLLPDRSVAVNRPVDRWTNTPDYTSGRTVVGSCGTQFVITQTATQVTIRVVSGVTAASRNYLPAADGTYALDHSTTLSSLGYSKKLASVSWRGRALDLVLTQYNSETPAGRVEYIFRFDRDDALTVEYLTGSGPFSTITSVYQRSTP
jgi:hypothetical protein